MWPALRRRLDHQGVSKTERHLLRVDVVRAVDGKLCFFRSVVVGGELVAPAKALLAKPGYFESLLLLVGDSLEAQFVE